MSIYTDDVTTTRECMPPIPWLTAMADTAELVGRKVDIYWNVNRACYSVRERANGTTKVIAHVSAVTLADARFVVSEAGRLRVLRERRKNVHAFVRGTITAVEPAGAGVAVRYNPYKGATFMVGETPITDAGLVQLTTTYKPDSASARILAFTAPT
jgi:hypothetical protein